MGQGGGPTQGDGDVVQPADLGLGDEDEPLEHQRVGQRGELVPGEAVRFGVQALGARRIGLPAGEGL